MTVQAREVESGMKRWRGERENERESNTWGETKRERERGRERWCVHVWVYMSSPFLYWTTRTRARMHLPTVSLLLMAAIRHPVYCPRGSVDISFVPRSRYMPDEERFPIVRAFDRATTVRESANMDKLTLGKKNRWEVKFKKSYYRSLCK